VTGRQDGFSYTEVLVSIAVISVAVLGFSANTASVIRGNRDSTNYTIASSLAQDKLEQLSALPVLNNVDRCPNSGEQGISAGGTPGGIYDRCWTIKDSALGSGLKEISVTVHWQDSEPREVALSTLIFLPRTGS
jgi:type II secretory pathway pseudopilin PulG